MEADSPRSGEPCSKEEVQQFFADMSPKQRDYAVRYAKWRAFNGHVDAEELVSEAYIRMVDGTRQCCRGENLFRVLLNTIRSLSSDRMFMTENAHIARLKAKGIRMSTVPADEVADILALPACESDDDNSDDLLFDAVMAEFEGDEQLMALAEAISEGYRGHDLEVLLEIDTKGLEALRTRFRRKSLAIREKVSRLSAKA